METKTSCNKNTLPRCTGGFVLSFFYYTVYRKSIMKIFYSLIYTTLTILTFTLCSHAGDFTVLTNQLPPIKMVKDGMATGMVGDVLTVIMKENGCPLEPGDTKQTPVAAAYNTVRDTPNHIFLALVRSPQREAHLKWVGPVYTSTMGFIAKKERQISISSAEDTRPYTIGSIKESASERMAITMGVNKERLVRFDGTSEALDKLVNGKIDLLIFPKSPAFYIMLGKNVDPDKYEEVYSIKSVDFYVGFNKNTDDELIGKLQESLDRMKQPDPSGMSPYQQIIGKYFKPTI